MRTEADPDQGGQHLVAAAFVRLEGPYEDLIQPHDWSFAGGGSGGPGITTLPHARPGHQGPPGHWHLGDASRGKTSCRPTSAAEERPCARQILSRIGGGRIVVKSRPAARSLTPLFDKAAARRLRSGVRSALEAIREPVKYPHGEGAGAGPAGSYRVADVDPPRGSRSPLGNASGSGALALANKGALSVPATLEKQTRRMLADPRRGPSARASRGGGCGCRTSTRSIRINSYPN
jgi:hypothetical protein